jgi:alcohol dehydrogenase class IV
VVSSPLNFEFATAGKILFGRGVAREIPRLAGELGKRLLVITGKTGRARYSPVFELLDSERQPPTYFTVEGEPAVPAIQQGLLMARENQCDSVLAIGGGSVIDAGKALAGMLTNDGELRDYLEVIGGGKPLSKPAAPLMAVPTTAGAGAEVTRNAVLLAPEEKVKVSLRSPFLLPRVALVDPELTLKLPPDLTASTGMDALTQLIEAFLSSKASPLTDAFCREGIPRAARSIRRAFADGSDLEARESMSLASLLSGLALANAGLGAAHGFAAPIGGMFAAPHGAVCASLLSHVLQVNHRVISTRHPGHPANQRFQEIAQSLTGSMVATPEDGLAWIEETCARLGIPSLGAFGITPAHFPELVKKAAKASSMRGNPVPLMPEELTEILQRALG